ncbi:MAG: hypothetical protein HY908_28080 [Myxococcales bacterium]|nr:hypothetical protein [Myxococcales bacterium]
MLVRLRIGAALGALGAACGGSSTDGAGAASAVPLTEPDPAFLPAATGSCPSFAPGSNVFSPAGTAPRETLVWATAGAGDGPLVFFWHGAGGSPDEAPYVLGDDALAAILDLGGAVVAPYHDPDAGDLPWYLALGGQFDQDLRVADEVLACARATRGVDLRHVHSVGFSAGAMHTEQFAARRSGYLASVVAYSGAQIGVPPIQDPRNRYPALLFVGGPSDVVGVSFAAATASYRQWLAAEGHFSVLCDHGLGHTVPSDGRAGAWRFLADHPFGASPEPYAGGLPAAFPSYCAL